MFKKKSQRLFLRVRPVFLTGLAVLISVLIIFTVVKASTDKITPPTGEPAATFYSLSEIYNFITANTAATAASPVLDWSIALEDTQYTLTEIYEKLRDLIVADKVFTGTTYLGTTGTLKLACATSTFDGISNLAGDTYDGGGNGANRWCVTDDDDITAADVLSGKIAWISGATTTGTMTDVGAQTITPGTSNTAITAGYHNGYGYCAGDAALITTNIRSGVSIFNVSGDSNVVNTSSGNAAAGDIADNKIAFAAGAQITGNMHAAQWLQTIDDWVSGAGTSGEYTAEEATWSTVSGSPFNAGFATSSNPLVYYPVGADVYLFSGRVKQDTRTGLMWSDVASTGAVTAVATSTTNNFTLTGVAGVGDGTRPWTTGTTTATNGNAINFCNALNAISFAGYSDWYLPTQKQLMQAYIDGSANNLPIPDYYFWSSTEHYGNTAHAWYVYLSTGYTYTTTKVNSNYVRCVRS